MIFVRLTLLNLNLYISCFVAVIMQWIIRSLFLFPSKTDFTSICTAYTVKIISKRLPYFGAPDLGKC